MPTSAADIWGTIASEAAQESPLWSAALKPAGEQERAPVFSSLADERFALGLETIYEGYLVHYGRSRLFAPPDSSAALLLGDYLYAHGLVRIAELGDVDAVRELAALISFCAHVRAEGSDGDGDAWARSSARLGNGHPDPGAVERALAAHSARVASV